MVAIVGAVVLTNRAMSPEIARKQESVHVLESLAQQIISETASTTSKKQSSVSGVQKVRDLWASSNKTQEVTEIYDPITGKLVSRKRTSMANKVSGSSESSNASKSVLTATLAEATTKTSSDVRKTTESTETSVTEYAVDKRSGVSFGIMASSEGVGPVASINIVSFKPVHLDFVSGMAPTPKVGVGVALEPFPRLSVGVAGVATFAGDKLGYYHPVFPVIGVAPAVTAQYRF